MHACMHAFLRPSTAIMREGRGGNSPLQSPDLELEIAIAIAIIINLSQRKHPHPFIGGK